MSIERKGWRIGQKVRLNFSTSRRCGHIIEMESPYIVVGPWHWKYRVKWIDKKQGTSGWLSSQDLRKVETRRKIKHEC